MAEQGWQPAFPGQRPPFPPGHELSMVHGARSERRVAPLMAEIERAARADPAWPPYLNDATYSSAVTSWARAEAIVELLWRWLSAQDDPMDAMASTLDSETTTEGGDGSSVSRTRARRVGSVLDQLRQWEASAARQRQRLGLDPLSRARLGRDITAAKLDLAQVLADERARQERGTPGGAAVAVEGGPAPGGEGDEAGVER